MIRELETSGAAGDHGELTRGHLSAEAEMLRDGLDLPIRLLPAARPGTREALWRDTLELNRLIAGQAPGPGPISLLAPHLPAGWRADLEAFLELRFEPLWEHREIALLAEGDSRSLRADWWRRVRASRRWAAVGAALNPERDFFEAWDAGDGGDFGLAGRGQDYTDGMAHFQAARAFGVESLLRHLGAFDGGLYLDVLGGDGYVLRLLEASRQRRDRRLMVAEVAPATLHMDAASLAAALDGALPAAGGVVVLAAAPAPGGGHGEAWLCRLLRSEPPRLETSGVFRLPGQRLGELLREPAMVRAGQGAAGAPPDPGGWPAAGGPGSLLITNDISRHMFYLAGLWGLATREDAHSLSRTFNPGSLDGVLFAYGTHHVLGLDAAVREAATLLRPGGRLVVHDFLGKGRVGRWFQQVVHPESRTGHAFTHPSPIEIVVYLLLAGLREVEIFEMEDPFVFAVSPDGAEDARTIASTYLAGMYGMTASFEGQHDRLRRLVEDILCYPEIGNVPRWDRDLVYVPRRAMVVSARRPAGEDAPLSPSDARLAARIAELPDAPAPRTLARRPIDPAVQRQWAHWRGTGGRG